VRPTPEDAAHVDVWFGSLDAPDAVLRELRETLSEDELEHASRFHFKRERDRYIAGRGLLRALLADYTGKAQPALRFEYSRYGKPRLRDGGDITFNVSHSANRVVFAVARGAPVGVDIEVLDSKPSDELVARQFFSDTEVRDFLALQLDARPRAFLTCWTRKEAFIKARGEGLNLPLQDFDVTLTPGVAPQLRRTAWDPSEPSQWLLFDLTDRCEGCVAALAVRARRATVAVGELELSAAGALTRAPARVDVATEP